MSPASSESFRAAARLSSRAPLQWPVDPEPGGSAGPGRTASFTTGQSHSLLVKVFDYQSKSLCYATSQLLVKVFHYLSKSESFAVKVFR